MRHAQSETETGRGSRARRRVVRPAFLAGLAALLLTGGAAAASYNELSHSGASGAAPAATKSAARTVATKPATSAPKAQVAHDASTTAATAASTASTVPTLMRTSNELPGLANAIDLGAAPSTDELTVDIGLTNPNSAAELAEYNSLYNPKSATYHQFLTPAQFDADFGLPAATVAATESWLRADGFTPAYVAGAGNMVTIHGTVAQLGALFKTSFGSYQVGPYKFIANTEAPAVPSDLPIDDVTGLNTLQRMWTESQVAEANNSPAAKPAATKSLSTSGYTGTLTPQDGWGVYDATPCVLDGSYNARGSGVTAVCPPDSSTSPKGSGTGADQPDVETTTLDLGQGETAGMFGSGYSNGVVSDLRVYEQQMGLPQVPVRVVDESEVTKGQVPSDNDNVAEDEWNLDNQAITGMAPRLSQDDLYFASTVLDPDFAVMFSAWANDANGPKQMNASFGECDEDPTSPVAGSLPTSNLTFGEGLTGNQMQLLSDSFLEQAVLEGRTLFASAGDSGGSCPSVILPVISAGNGVYPQPGGVSQNYPCDSAWAVCVGGTVVTTNGTTNPTATGAATTDATDAPYREAEQSWAFTGGGSSDNVPEPSFQDGDAAVDRPCTSPVDVNDQVITPGTTCRGVPDVAAMSGAGTIDGEVEGANAYLANIDNETLGVGGTSLSSPLTVGMWARIQAASPKVRGKYTGLGFADPTFYRVGENAAEYAKDFYNVDTCELPTCNFYNPQLPAGDSPSSEIPDGTGWNYNSGWGAIDVDQFIADPLIDNDPSLIPTHPGKAVAAGGESSVPNIVPTCAATLTSPLENALDPTTTVFYPYTNNPQLDITKSTVTVSGGNLVVTIGGPSLSLTPPPDGTAGYNFYTMLTDAQGSTFFVTAEVNPSPAVDGISGVVPVGVPLSTVEGNPGVTYGDGVVSGFEENIVNTDTGTFNDVDGLKTFTITVPLANLVKDGMPSLTDTLSYPFTWDNLPNGVFVAFAEDEAVAPDPSYQFNLTKCG
jgi:pseudomonalisin